MSEIRRNYDCVQQAAQRLLEAPNLCGMGGSPEAGPATAEMLVLAINEGFYDGVLRVAQDVLMFLAQDEQYKHEWGDTEKAATLIACLADSLRSNPEKIDEAISLLTPKASEGERQ